MQLQVDPISLLESDIPMSLVVSSLRARLGKRQSELGIVLQSLAQESDGPGRRCGFVCEGGCRASRPKAEEQLVWRGSDGIMMCLIQVPL